MIENNENLKDDEGNENTNFQRAYVNGKIGGVAVQAGRYNNKIAEGNVYDTRFDGVQLSYGKDVKLTAGYGKATPSTVVRLDNADAWYADLSGKVGSLALSAGYVDFQDISGSDVDFPDISDVDSSVWNVAANYAFDKNFKLGAMYLKGEDHDLDIDDDGFVVTASYKGAIAAKAGSWGLVAKYYDQGATTYADHTMNGKADKMLGFKGYSVAANYTFAKNIVGQVEWYDLEAKEGNKDAQTLWSQVVFTF